MALLEVRVSSLADVIDSWRAVKTYISTNEILSEIVRDRWLAVFFRFF